MTTILAIDPGPFESAYSLIDADTRKPLKHDKIPNGQVRMSFLWSPKRPDHYAIEMIASYGMAVGAEVFQTCVWIGRFAECILTESGYEPDLIKRQTVKLHHCNSPKAKDSNVIQALVDRFAMGEPNKGKGTKANPGWFYGFSKDVWQAYALAVYVADAVSPAIP